MVKKRLWKTKLGIPVWLIIGLCVFLISSASYEIYQEIAPWNTMTNNLVMIAGASLILIIALVINFTKISTIKRIFRGQLGG
jgi:hypothetical protein